MLWHESDTHNLRMYWPRLVMWPGWTTENLGSSYLPHSRRWDGYIGFMTLVTLTQEKRNLVEISEHWETSVKWVFYLLLLLCHRFSSEEQAIRNLDSMLKSRDITLQTKGPYSQSCGFSSSHIQMWESDHKGWLLKNWFQTVVLEKSLWESLRQQGDQTSLS